MRNGRYDAIVIGSGPGGTTCAALLAKAGLKTLLVEKNNALGGKMMTISRKGFLYDLWPHGQVPMRGSAFETVFKELGVESEFEPALSPDDPRDVVGISYRANGWKDYRSVAFGQTLQDATPFFDLWGLGDSEREKAVRFLATMVMMPPEELDELDDLTMHEFISQHDVPYALYSYLAFHANASLAEPIDLVSASEQVRIMQQIAFRGGGGYYKGSFGRLIDVMVREFQARGGQLRTRSRVDLITVEDGRVTGIVTNGERLAAPIVVSSAGIQPTVLKLVGVEHFDRGYVNYVKDLVPGWGFTAIRYFLSRPVLKLPMYVAYADDSWWNLERFEAVKAGRIPDEIILFMSVISNYDPDLAPPGKQMLLAGTICSPSPGAQEIEALWSKTDEMLNRLLPEVAAAVEFKEYSGPADVSSATRDAVLPGQGGECVGLGQIVGQCGRHKPSPRAPIRGLFYVGSDAGGAGMGTHQAADSGIKVARLAVQHHRKQYAGW